LPADRARSLVRTLFALAAIALAVLATFGPALAARFVLLDDDYNVLSNPHFRGFTAQSWAWRWSASWNGNYQPLAWLSLALDHTAAGLEPARYHATNLVLHGLTSGLVFLVARALLARARPAAGPEAEAWRRDLAALVAALAFAVHPLRAESVAWVTDRNDLLAGLFAVAATGCWLQAVRGDAPPARRSTSAVLAGALVFLLGLAASLDPSDPDRLGLRWAGAPGLLAAFVGLAVSVAASAPAGARAWHAAACAAFLLSLLSKGAAVALPLVLLVLDLYPLRRFGRVASRQLLAEKVPLAALSLAAAGLASWSREARLGSAGWLVERSLPDRAAQAVQALAFYPWKTLVPRALVPIVDVPARTDWLAPSLLLPALAVALGAALLVAFRRRAPAWSTAFAAYALLVAPALGLVPFGTQLVSDRYSYVACLPFAFLAGGAWLACASATRHAAKLALPAAVLVLAALGALAVLARRQTAVWHDSESLFSHQLRFDETPRALSNLAIVWNERASEDPAGGELWLDRAEAASRRAVDLAQERGVFVPEYRLHLGTILLNRGKVAEALEHLRWFVAERPENMQGWTNLGLALLRLERYDEAAAELRRAVEGREASADVWRLLGMAFEGQGRRADAIGAYRRALRLAPDLASAADRLRALEAGR
jgi:tetratricopeptide (TPR) repeat protein